MSSLLEVKNISGFPEFLPETQLQFDNFLQTIRRCFQLHGALPIETPAVERISVLQAKETTNKEIYAIRRLVQDEHSDVKDLALKFDLTIPLARYTATHFHQLTFPFRRYQIQPVWRGERPQSGRYRQFYQCDFDIIGNQKLSVNYDAETIFILYDVLKNISIEKFCIHINHRQILNGFLCSLLQKDSFYTTELNAILQIIDGVHKEDKNTITRQLSNLNFTQSQIQTLWEFLTSPPSLKELAQKYSKNTLFLEGIEKLQSVLDCLSALEIPQQHFNIDFSIVRGLDYYTGTIFETFLDNKKIGSIASGGRYDNLTQRFIKRNLPGVGFSLGLSRLFSVLKLQPRKTKGPAYPLY